MVYLKASAAYYHTLAATAFKKGPGGEGTPGGEGGGDGGETVDLSAVEDEEQLRSMVEGRQLEVNESLMYPPFKAFNAWRHCLSNIEDAQAHVTHQVRLTYYDTYTMTYTNISY